MTSNHDERGSWDRASLLEELNQYQEIFCQLFFSPFAALVDAAAAADELSSSRWWGEGAAVLFFLFASFPSSLVFPLT